ncbi:uncharacterized protein SCHCODRAFT_02672706 [Schizophyllum commune H4-8]|uniref:uncharacterized protein n=1 Tax=Schizophyllum commune (strain H4-8 / FGSC 9210) TaxID=578458 RepID=UPI00215FE91A|nr:uncharacterized protein SCHCODRAFT_02672706 [Schizophyllum commune H4-8]KAI5886532.1 hypothetical protein SCHCODRAFT_02672706 [Schizophyllum commune H4-8]
MNILEHDYPNEEHWFVYDNTTIHRKRADDTLSAHTNFGIKKTVTDAKGNVLHELKMTVWLPMKDTSYTKVGPDGKTLRVTQCLYHPLDPEHPDLPGRFKGMAEFLPERGFREEAGLLCDARGFCVLFLPKFHCELNFIEQAWGAAKHAYRMYPASSSEEDLVRNVHTALDTVSLETMRQ